MATHTLDRTYDGRTMAGARRQQRSDARRLADEGYRVVDETAYVVNPTAPKTQQIVRLISIYQQVVPDA
jgi:hypothetical protein